MTAFKLTADQIATLASMVAHADGGQVSVEHERTGGVALSPVYSVRVRYRMGGKPEDPPIWVNPDGTVARSVEDAHVRVGEPWA